MVVEVAPRPQVESTTAREIEDRYGPQMALCYQCKKCTSGCPVADVMDFRPHQAVQLVRLGATDRLLKSDAIWTCVGCYLCTTRCPQGVPVADLMYSLKRQAMKRDLPSRRAPVPAFLKAFASSVERNGRNREAEMIGRYFLATDPRAALKEMPTGLKLFRQGRLPLWGHKSRGRKAMRAILNKARRLGGTS